MDLMSSQNFHILKVYNQAEKMAQLSNMLLLVQLPLLASFCAADGP